MSIILAWTQNSRKSIIKTNFHGIIPSIKKFYNEFSLQTRCRYWRLLRGSSTTAHVNLYHQTDLTGIPGHKNRWSKCVCFQCDWLFELCFGPSLSILHFRKSPDWRGKVLNKQGLLSICSWCLSGFSVELLGDGGGLLMPLVWWIGRSQNICSNRLPTVSESYDNFRRQVLYRLSGSFCKKYAILLWFRCTLFQIAFTVYFDKNSKSIQAQEILFKLSFFLPFFSILLFFHLPK